MGKHNVEYFVANNTWSIPPLHMTRERIESANFLTKILLESFNEAKVQGLNSTRQILLTGTDLFSVFVIR